MITLMSVFVLLGFWCCYQTSTRAVLTNGGSLARRIRQHATRSRLAGLLILLVGLVFGIVYLGLGTGIFAFFMALMTIGSLTVLLAPLRLINYEAVAVVFLVSLLLEIAPN